MNNQEACRIVGISSPTGRRWHDGRNPTGKNVGATDHLDGASRRAWPLPEREHPIHIADQPLGVASTEVVYEFGLVTGVAS
ncbi:hypothetical protein E1286_17780 [Nonomuraea terrae]|uniref:Uncharacterized protein n=1 Tax=Nonomuraea terrae TaxID=2530383 RepID=A0A4R4YQF2_9ACTN|nr:hypothetical protein [Nonomuraea terrae]TDD47381.1 hypothetical protein E1286_17780 [Nonomuraea terrae]